MNEIPKKKSTTLNIKKILKQSKTFNNVDIVMKLSCFIIKYDLIILFSFLRYKTEQVIQTASKLVIFNINLSSFDQKLMRLEDKGTMKRYHVY